MLLTFVCDRDLHFVGLSVSKRLKHYKRTVNFFYIQMKRFFDVVGFH